jgi:hypothetical protein
LQANSYGKVVRRRTITKKGPDLRPFFFTAIRVYGHPELNGFHELFVFG